MSNTEDRDFAKLLLPVRPKSIPLNFIGGDLQPSVVQVFPLSTRNGTSSAITLATTSSLTHTETEFDLTVAPQTITIVVAPPENETPKVDKRTRDRETDKKLRWCLLFGLLFGLLLHGFTGASPIDLISRVFLTEKATAATLTGSATEVKPTSVAIATTNSSNVIPTKLYNNAPVPAWEQINFKSFVFSSDGNMDLPPSNEPGYKAHRSWTAGQSLDQVMHLGDFEQVFSLEKFSLKDIESLAGISLKNVNLSQFSLAKWQSIPELTKALPQLSNQYVADIPPIDDLVTKILGVRVGSDETVGQLIQENPQLKDVELGEIDLSKYKLSSIPGIEQAKLGQFDNWQNASISKIPGLSNITFDKFPLVPVPQGNIVAKVDLPLREIEANRQKSISGSYQAGFNVPCSTKCAHIEVAGEGNITGAQWMSGKFQQVKGGFGILGALNGGKEPTGRNPFGKAFKQVIWDINEADGSITTAMFFRICKRGGLFDMGCSPYFLGPFPFLPYKETSPIFLGTPLDIPTRIN